MRNTAINTLFINPEMHVPEFLKYMFGNENAGLEHFNVLEIVKVVFQNPNKSFFLRSGIRQSCPLSPLINAHFYHIKEVLVLSLFVCIYKI